MNQQERDALRHKHRKLWDGSPVSALMCAWSRTDYPCDVIKVLDVYENGEME
jgi:hypothetical protein